MGCKVGVVHDVHVKFPPSTLEPCQEDELVRRNNKFDARGGAVRRQQVITSMEHPKLQILKEEEKLQPE
jgi:hypothetical protein